MSTTLRLARENDLGALLALDQENLAESWSREDWEQIFDSENRSLLCVESGEEISGFILLAILPDIVEVHKLVVSPSKRRKGLGSELLRAAGLHVVGKEIWLEVRAGNEPARRLYLKCGFEVVAIRKNYYSEPSEDAICFKKAVD